jgi:hypothetical protein
MATEMKRVGSLDIEEDLPFQRWQWRVQRVGWVLMAIAALSALAGLLGPGPLSSTTAAAPGGGLEVEYNQFERNSRHTELRVRVAGDRVRDGQVQLWLDSSYAHKLQMLSIQPQPERVEAHGDRQVYTFNAAAGPKPVQVTLHYEHKEAGKSKGGIGLVNGPEVLIDQLVYP